MKSNYDYYVIGCERTDLAPLPQWQFQLTYTAYQVKWRLANRPLRGGEVARLVRLGKIAAGNSGTGSEEGGATAGVRKPDLPQEPVLTSQAARPLLEANTPDVSFWRV